MADVPYDPQTPAISGFPKFLSNDPMVKMASRAYHVLKGDSKPEDAGKSTGEGLASKVLSKVSPGYDKLKKATK